MLSIKFIKFQLATYVLQYKNGEIKREGAIFPFFIRHQRPL
jgi:hypothetical protein